MDLSLAVSPVVLAVAAVAAGALSWVAYGRSTPRVTGATRVGLAALRFAALFLVLLLLLEPVWTRISRSAEPPLLAVLVDDSASLTLGDGPTDALRDALDGLPADAALRFYRFDADARPVGDALPGDSLQFEGERTDLAAALTRVEGDFAGRNLRGVVLLSDGRSTDGRNPAYLAERSPVPIWTATVGDSVSTRDVRLAQVVTNDVARVGSPLPIRAAVRASGFAGQTAPVTVSSGGRVVARGRVEVPADGAEATVDLDVTPGAPGVRRFTVAVGPLAGEATARNNRQTVAVRVLDDDRRLLLVAAAPGPDVAALRAVLDADASIDLTVRIQRSPGFFYEGAIPDALGQFDAVVLAGYPGRAADAVTADRIASAIADGLPALFVMTSGTDLSRLAESFGEVLPVAQTTPRAGSVEAGLAPTPTGEAHPVFDLGVPPARLRALPPLAVSPSRFALRPGARVLATVRRGATVLDAPLVAVRQNGRVRSAAVLGAGTWRWRTLPDDLGDLRGAYAGFVDRLVRWATAPRDRRPVRVRPDRALFGERDRVTFTGQVYGDGLDPIDDARVELAISGPDDASATMRPLGNGRYVADFGVLPPGRYGFTARAAQGGAALGTDRGGFAVGQIAAEFARPGADPALMRQVAVRSGGAVVGLDTLGAFVRGLRTSGALADRPLVREDATPLLGMWPLLALALALLTAEWVWRKRAGMV